MKKTKYLTLLVAIGSLFATSCAETNQSSVESELPPVVDSRAPVGEKTPAELIAEKQNKIKSSRPTKIVTDQSYFLAGDNLDLHFNSVLVVEYGSVVKSSYGYSYEKLNEIITGEESLVSIITGTVYSEGSYVGDGIDWVNQIESSTTLRSLSFTNSSVVQVLVNTDNEFAGRVVDGMENTFFAADYGVSNLEFSFIFDDLGRVDSLELKFSAKSYNGMRAQAGAYVVSNSYYSYNQETVSTPR